MMSRGDNLTRGQAFVIIATLLWPLQEAFGGMLMERHAAAQVVALRYITHLLLLGLFVVPRYGLRVFATQRPGLQLLRGLCMFGMPAGFILAASVTQVDWIWTIFWFMPAIALIGAMLIMHERPDLFARAAALVAPLGAAAIWEASPGNLPGTAASLLMGASFAGYIVLSRVLRDEKLFASLFYTAVGALLPMCLFVWQVWTPVTAADIVPTLVTGVLSLFILGTFDVAVDAAPVTVVAPIISLALVWELVLRVLQHHSPVFAADLFGIVLISMSCILYLSWHHVQVWRQRRSA